MPETLKIILAVMGIFILAYLVFSFYGMFVKNTKLEQAKATLNQILEGLDWLDYMEKNNKFENKIMLTSPKDWYLLELNMNGVSKLCICENLGRDDEKQVNLCNEKGVCEKLNQKIIIENFEQENYIYDTKFLAKRKAVKIEIVQLVIKKQDGIYNLYKGIEEAGLDNVLREFLSEKIEISEISEEVKGLDKEVFSKNPVIEDLIKVLCIEPKNWYENGNSISLYNNDLHKQIEKYFENKLNNEDFVAIGFKIKSDENPDLSKCGLMFRDSYFRYPLVLNSCETDNQEDSQIYKTIQLNSNEYCIIYLTSNKNDF